MSVDRRLLNWGVFLVLLGGVPLAIAQGWIPRAAVERAWELWPLILIGAGVGLILSRTPLQALGGLVVAGTFGIILGAIVAVGFTGIGFGSFGCGQADAAAPEVLREQGAFDGGSGTVILEAHCAALRVVPTAGAGWSVGVRGPEGSRPTVERAAGRLEVRGPNRPFFGPFGGSRTTWDVALGRDARLDLRLTVNAGEADIDLAGATLSGLSFTGNAMGSSTLDLSTAAIDSLDVTVNAGDLGIILPASGSLRGTVAGNAASVGLCAAPGVGLRLRTDDNITASNNFDDRGLVRSGTFWETPGFAGAAAKVELDTTGGAVSFTLNPEDGCR